jgi:hypothetical protein
MEQKLLGLLDIPVSQRGKKSLSMSISNKKILVHSFQGLFLELHAQKDRKSEDSVG